MINAELGDAGSGTGGGEAELRASNTSRQQLISSSENDAEATAAALAAIAASSAEIVSVQQQQQLKQPSFKQRSTRLKSVDVFRGCALCLMIFVNYGAGDYAVLDHAIWNGLHLADIVFPSFVFIMGLSIPLSYRSMSVRALNRSGLMSLRSSAIRPMSVLYKILKRSALLFFFGLVTSNSSDQKLFHQRLMGVLQRFAISYAVGALAELVYFARNNYVYSGVDLTGHTWRNAKWLVVKANFEEIFFYPFQWLFFATLVLVWTLVTFLVAFDDCPAGYLGPGGMHDMRRYVNCTGGAAGYIDRLIIGEPRLYQTPTCKAIYATSVPYDPEGLLGCLTSCALTYIGMSAGHVLIHYPQRRKRLFKFVMYACVYGLAAGLLCNFSVDGGWIPINKNLWSLSFVLATAAISLLVFSLLYVLIDVFELASGAPFSYLGRNSITIYICHIIFQAYFPFFQIDQSHAWLLALDFYGVGVWILLATIMDKKKVYINL